MCRNYDAGECVEEGCTGRITCHDFTDQRCTEHSYNGRNASFNIDDDDSDPVEAAAPGGTTYDIGGGLSA